MIDLGIELRYDSKIVRKRSWVRMRIGDNLPILATNQAIAVGGNSAMKGKNLSYPSDGGAEAME